MNGSMWVQEMMKNRPLARRRLYALLLAPMYTSVENDFDPIYHSVWSWNGAGWEVVTDKNIYDDAFNREPISLSTSDIDFGQGPQPCYIVEAEAVNRPGIPSLQSWVKREAGAFYSQQQSLAEVQPALPTPQDLLTALAHLEDRLRALSQENNLPIQELLDAVMEVGVEFLVPEAMNWKQHYQGYATLLFT